MSVPGLGAWMSRNLNDQARFSDDKRGELRNILMSGLTQKYNAPTTSVEKEVDRFLSTGRASQSNLDRLERHVQHRAARTEGKANSVTTALTDFSTGTKSVRSQSVRSQATSTKSWEPMSALYTPRLRPLPETRVVPGTPRSTMSNTGRSVTGANWADIARYAQQLEQQDKTRRIEGVKEMKKNTRAELDLQIKQRDQREKEQKLEELTHFKAQQLELEQWADMETDREEQRRDKAATMKKEREEQVMLNRKLREEEIRKRKQEEKDLVEKIAIELEKEKQRLADEKQKKKMHMNKILHESEEERRVKALKAKEDSKAEVERTRAFQERLDDQDEAKRKEAEKKEEEQKQNLLKMKAVMEAQIADNGAADQKLAEIQKREADGRANAIMQHREDRLKEMRQQNQAFLFQQMEEKRIRKEEEAVLTQLNADLAGAENRAFLDMEKQRSTSRRERNVAHRKLLEKQIAENQALEERKDALSTHELALNKQVLKSANKLHAEMLAEQL